MLLSGKVKWYDKKKGYGFVETPSGDAFIHHSFFAEEFVPDDNDLVSFEIEPGEKGLRAKNVVRYIITK